MAGSVIQVTGRMDFEDGLRNGITRKEGISIHSVQGNPQYGGFRLNIIKRLNDNEVLDVSGDHDALRGHKSDD